jgi:hypothetical protein
LGGIRPSELLGYPVRLFERRVLYLAMDRPPQVKRSMRRMVAKDDVPRLDARMSVWKGPLPFDLRKDVKALANWIGNEYEDIGVVFADSVKDLVPGPSQDEVGSAINMAIQEVMAREIQWLGLHHMRKATGENRRPNSLDDVYGSTWITAGAGSVVLLLAKPGSEVVELSHLKQPAAVVGPLDVFHDHATGTSITQDVSYAIDLMLEQAGASGVLEAELAEAAFKSDDKVACLKVKRMLEKRQRSGARLERLTGGKGGSGGGGTGARWVLKS